METNLNILEEDETLESVRRRPKVFEPKSIGDYRKIMQPITGRPMKLICIKTSFWPPDWYIQMASDCKEKDKVTQAKIINWWLKKTNLTQI